MRLSRLFFLLLAGLAVSPAADAAFQITITETGGGSVTIFDDSGDDNESTLTGVIDANTGVINGALLYFDFRGLSAFTNQALGTPGSLDAAQLNILGSLSRRDNGDASARTVTIEVTATDYDFPAGNPKFMDSAASDNWGNTSAADGRTFQGFFGPGNTDYETTVPSTLQTFDPEDGEQTFGTSTPGGTLTDVLGDQPDLFSLTSRTVITLGPVTSASAIPSDNFSGNISVTAIPEPSTLALLVLAAPAVALIRRRVR